MPTTERPSGTIGRRAVLQLAGAAAGATALTAAATSPTASAAPLAGRARTEVSFDADWKFLGKPVVLGQAMALNDSSWRPLDLPHDWSIEDLPGGSDDGGATTTPATSAFYSDKAMVDGAPRLIGPFSLADSQGGRGTAYTVNGEGWYRKTFRLADVEAGDRVTLRFDGVYCNSDVWLNDHHLGFHPNGYTVFEYDLTPFLRADGDNVIAVRVQNVGNTGRWYSGSGIYRHTWLTVTKPVCVPLWGINITTPTVSSRSATVVASVEVANHAAASANTTVTWTVKDRSGNTVASTTSAARKIAPGSVNTSFDFSHQLSLPKLWSPETPNLYVGNATVKVNGTTVDRVTETFGIRSIVMNRSGFKLNGKSIKMRGGNIHHTHGPLGAVTLDRSEERRVQLLKDAGFNAIRSAHNAPNPALLAACDRIGMLVYDELTDVWDAPKTAEDYHLYFPEWWKRDATSWVLSGRNHPSVVIRSIGNEIGAAGAPLISPVPDASVGARGKQLADFVRALDPTRPICQGGGQGILILNPSPQSPADAYTDVGDVHYTHDVSDRAAANPTKPFLQSESFVATMYADWKLVTENDYFIGDFVWAAWDYLGEAGVGTPMPLPEGTERTPPIARGLSGFPSAAGYVTYPVYSAGCGDFDLIGQRRAQLLYRRVNWGMSPLELVVDRPLAPGMEAAPVGWAWYDALESWSWDVPATQTLTVRAYTTGDSVILKLNGLPIGVATVLPTDEHIATFHVPFVAGTLTAEAYRLGVLIASKTLTTVGKAAGLRLTSDVTTLTTSRNDLSHVLVEVVDAQNRVLPDAVVKVDFQVVGGQLIAVGNGNNHNVDTFQRPRRWTHHGRALAILRPPKTPGYVTLTARAAGLASSTLTLKVTAPPTRQATGADSLASIATVGFAAFLARRDRGLSGGQDA